MSPTVAGPSTISYWRDSGGKIHTLPGLVDIYARLTVSLIIYHVMSSVSGLGCLSVLNSLSAEL